MAWGHVTIILGMFIVVCWRVADGDSENSVLQLLQQRRHDYCHNIANILLRTINTASLNMCAIETAVASSMNRSTGMNVWASVLVVGAN